jgi:predicted MFS family arabinose efflux permease
MAQPSRASPQKQAIRAREVFALLSHRPFAIGMMAVALFFFGQFTLFTYLRPFLDMVTAGRAPLVSALLLGLGVAGFLGTILIGMLLKSRLYSLLIVIPLLMAGIAHALIWIAATPLNVGLLLALWGLLGTSAPVAWWMWLSKTMPHEAEAGGGLMVAIVQLAIMLGAIVGGLLFDAWGYRGPFGFAAAVLIGAALMAAVTARAADTPYSAPGSPQ